MKRRILVSVLALAAAGAVGACWFLLDRRSQAEQLLEILAGQNLPDAAWAWEKLVDVGDEDLRSMVQYLDDLRPTPIPWSSVMRTIHQRSKKPPTLRDLALRVLSSRTFVYEKSLLADDAPRDPSPDTWDNQRWSEWVEKFLATYQRPGGILIEPKPSKSSFFGSVTVRPPSPPPSLFSAATPENTTLLVNALCSPDSARAVWFLETLRGSPVDALDALQDHIQSMEPTRVRCFSGRQDAAIRADGIALGHIIQLLLTERLGDARLHYDALRAADTHLQRYPQLAARIESAWRAYRGN